MMSRKSSLVFCLPFVCFVYFVVPSFAADACVSGLAAGERPGPYSFVICTGSQRGQSCCFICDTADRPAVLVFARTTSDPLGKLVQQLDKAVADHKMQDLRGWVTFLAKDQSAIDAEVIGWGQKHAIRAMPLGVFEDVEGPPSYKLHSEADVTVLLFVKQKVVANFAFRAGELTDAKAAEVTKALPQIVGQK